MLSEDTNKRIKRLNQVFKDCCQGIHTVTFRESNRGESLIIFEGSPEDLNLKEFEQKRKELKKEEFLPENCSIQFIGSETAAGQNDKAAGSGPQYIYQYLDGLRFRISSRAFLQVNSSQTDRLYSLVLDWANLKGSEEVWDLYCGAGTMTLMLAKRAGKAIGIEENPHAVKDAEANAQDNGIPNVRFIQGKAEEKLKSLSGTPDLVVTDPPRAGMERAVLARLLQIKPSRIIYVSCNPATLARDLKILTQGDEKLRLPGAYEAVKVQPVDMFPWTSHVECIIMMTNSGLEGK